MNETESNVASEKINSLNQKHKWPLLYITGVLFCFVFFPLFLLDIGIESYVKVKEKSEEQTAYRNLEINLEKLLQYGDSKHYYHALLKKIFDFAESQGDAVAYLEKAIPHLKSRNPGAFNFVIWNKENDKIIDSITDEKGYKYVLSTINETLKAVAEANDLNYPVDPKRIGIVNDKLSIISSYIGHFLVADSLLQPLLKANLGKAVPVSSNREKSYFWYQSGKKITILATISQKSIDSLSHIERLINGMNKASKNHIKYGIVDIINDKTIIDETDSTREAEINLGLIKQGNFSNSKLYTNNYYLLVKILNPFVRAFCYIPKSDVHTIGNLRRNTLMGAFLFFLLLGIGIWAFYKKSSLNFSIGWKLSILFLYANGLPLLALGFVGFDYVQQSKNIQLEEAYESISQLINDFDSKFGEIKQEYANKFNFYVNKINSGLPKTEEIQTYSDFLKEAKKTNFQDFYITDQEGNQQIEGASKNFSTSMKSITKNLVNFVNNKVYTPLEDFGPKHSTNSKNEKTSIDSLLTSGLFFHTIVYKCGTIALEHVVDQEVYYYFNFVGNKAIRDFQGMVTISWQIDQLQENYAKQHIDGLNKNGKGIIFKAFSEKYGKVFPNNSTSEKELYSRFRQISNLTSLSFEEVKVNGKSYAAFGSMGRELGTLAIIGLFPLDAINEKMAMIWFKFFLFGLFSLVITFGASWLLYSAFLMPLKDLRGGIEAIGQQDFKHRLPIKTADEFGALSGVFNSALENLEDLAVATTVQENLFPQEPLSQDNIYVWGKSVTMTRLGGDYYDYFSLDDDQVGVLMGDVAGHGVPAGFLMAMAKASVLLSGEEKKSPAKLLSAVHKVFHHVKNKKIKRMMTCIYFCINSKTGSYKVVNAGHCYPAIVAPDGSVELVEMIGAPLGITKKARHVDIEGQLKPGSTMLLYTDGILEAHNEQGEPFGIERFKQLVAESYSHNPEEFYNKLFAGYKAWTPMADDDITMVIVKVVES